jgi:2-C-methyl-D-erythritol 4-phosphate cytidylyltransferase
MKTTAIIVAAGSGSRFNSESPKQFVELAGKPIIFHTLEKFEACAAVDEILLVLSAQGRRIFERISGRHSFPKLKKFVTGGSTRAESVKNGLERVEADCDIVTVHDAARPLVKVDEITRTIVKAAEVGAACLVADVTDTLKKVDPQNGLIQSTVDRKLVRRALTPQAFRLSILQHAFRHFELDATDECNLVERLDYYYKIAYVEGGGSNIKITHNDDLAIAEALLNFQN